MQNAASNHCSIECVVKENAELKRNIKSMQGSVADYLDKVKSGNDKMFNLLKSIRRIGYGWDDLWDDLLDDLLDEARLLIEKVGE